MQEIKKNIIASNDVVHHLLNAAKQGDPQALAGLYDQYSAILFGFISRIIDDSHIAERVLQNSFIVIWKSLPAYDSEKERILTWMLKISLQVAIDALPDTIVNSETIISEPSDIKILNSVITHIFFKGLSLGDAANKLEIPLNLLIPKMKMAFKQLHGGQVQ